MSCTLHLQEWGVKPEWPSGKACHSYASLWQDPWFNSGFGHFCWSFGIFLRFLRLHLSTKATEVWITSDAWMKQQFSPFLRHCGRIYASERPSEEFYHFAFEVWNDSSELEWGMLCLCLICKSSVCTCSGRWKCVRGRSFSRPKEYHASASDTGS